MAQQDRVAEELRRRLYGPSASQADLAAYLDRAEPEPAAERPAAGPERRPSRGLLRIGVAVAGSVLVLAAGAAAIGVSASRPASEATPVPSSAVGWTAAPRDPGDGVGVASVVDGGVRAHATGTVSVASDTAYGYTTARGDTAAGIAQRFGLCDADVVAALPSRVDPARITAGLPLLLRRDAASRTC